MATTFTITMPDDSRRRLHKLCAKTSGTEAEVLANALRLYEDVITLADKGDSFSVTTKEGQTTPYKVF